MVNPLNPHYSFCNPGTVFDEEALTALELSARTAKKVNECVGEVNKIPDKIADEVRNHIHNGTFDQQIDTHTKELTEELQLQTAYYTERIAAHAAETNARINALAQLEEGSTTGDAELIDGRISFNGTEYPTLGAALRAQFRHFNMNLVSYNYYLEIDTTANTATFTTNSDGAVTMSVLRRNGEMRVNMPKPTPVSIDLSGAGEMCFLWLSMVNPDGECAFFDTANRYITPGPADVLLAVVSGDNVYPVSLSGANIKVNGMLLHEMPTPNRMRPYSSGMVLANGKVRVRVSNNSGIITLPKGAFIGFPLHNNLGVYNIPEDISVSWEFDGMVQHVIMNPSDYRVYMADRRHKFLDNEIWLGYVHNAKFTPVELPSECVEFTLDSVSTNPGVKTTMEDYFRDLEKLPGAAPFKIVLLGDSITHGNGGTDYAQDGEKIITWGGREYRRNPNGFCWANLFKDYIETNYNATVTNNACSGFNSNTIRDTMTELIPDDADLVILTIGTNDRTLMNDASGAIGNLSGNLNTIISYCHSKGTRILLCTCIPASAANEAKPDNHVPIFRLNQAIKTMCSLYNLECADIHNGVFFHFLDKGLDYESHLPDGLHPNDALHRQLFYEYLRAFRLAPHCNRIYTPGE